jgi:methionyl-tRNA formyltransferase
LINNESQTGITSFFIDENIDTGDILFQQKIKIDERINAGDLHDKLQFLAAEVTEKTIDGILKNELKPLKQITTSNLKTAYKFDKKNIQINWDNDALSIYNKIRGLDPFPGARTTLYLNLEKEEKKLLIYKSDYIIEKHKDKTGNVIVSDGVLKISCNNGYVIINELKVEGKKKMKTRDLLNGFRISDNSYVK